MSYQQKYLKYKKKYLQLLELTGGAAAAPGITRTTNPTDVLSPDGVVKCVCGEVFANPEFGAPRSDVFTLDCDYKVDPCYNCGKHICIYCGDEVARIPGRSNGEYSAHNTPGKEPTIGSYDAHFGWAPHDKRPDNGGSWPRNSGWCLKRPDGLFKKSDRIREGPLHHEQSNLESDILEFALELSLKQEKERQQKECKACTFLNQPDRIFCEMCGTKL
jgi:hypothetical protein